MKSTETILKLNAVSKEFGTRNGTITILDDVSFAIKKGEKVAIIGPSGSGKSTLLSIIGLLDIQTSGVVEINGVDTQSLSEKEQALFRNKNIGFIFQSFELISPFTVHENITAPLEIAKKDVSKKHVDNLIKELGLSERSRAMPNTLSGGEKQRVATGRALINEPPLILADEPTGSLDTATGENVMSLLLDATNRIQTTLLIITHDETIANKMDRVFELRNNTLHERI